MYQRGLIADDSLDKRYQEPDSIADGGYQNTSGAPTRGFKDDEEDDTAKHRSITILGNVLDYELLVSKGFYFFFFSAFGSLFPLIAVYFKQLGMNATQAGFLVGIRPFIEFTSAPFWGTFADRFRKGKILILFSLISWIVFTVALAFIQPGTPYCLAKNATGNLYLVAPRTEAVMNHKMENWDTAVSRVPGIAPLYIEDDKVSDYDPEHEGVLVRPPYSSRVYRKAAVEEVFLLLLLLIILGEFFSAPAITLADACTLNALKDQPEMYGKQRMFGSLGWALSMFFVGIGLDYSRAFPNHPCGYLEVSEKNYTLCFAVFSVLMACALLAATQFNFITHEADRPDEVPRMIMDLQLPKVDPAVAENARARAPEPVESSRGPRWFGVLKTFCTPHYAAFLVVTWWMGFGIGLVFCFLFWHLQDLGGTPTLFGIASVINHVSEVLAYFFSFRLINQIGHVKVLYVGLIANIARFLYVSWLWDPWWVLPFEFVQGISHAAVWAAATSYMSLAAPPTQKSTAQGILQGVHHGLGRGCGALVGGIIITYTGTKIMFRIYGLICLLVLLGFFLINRFCKAEGIKYHGELLEEDGGPALAPHGIPMNVPYSPSEERKANYGATEPLPDPTQDAYDRYVHEPYQKPVQFDQLPNFGTHSTRRK